MVIARRDDHWELGLGSTPAPILSNTYERAFAVAGAFAKHHRVAVWVTRDGGESFELATTCRADSTPSH